MFVKQTSTVSKNYFEYVKEQERAEKEIWSSINVKELTVVDFGVGESTKKLIDLGAKVIAVDRDLEKLKKYDNLDISLIKCDITNFPFDNRIAELAVFYFTLHKIDPLIHKEVISTTYKISPRIMVVEPSPKGCLAYQRYAELWHNAMHSIDRFEDYQPISYWKKLIESCGFEIIV
jgi:ubiquinone/menaquinone biosynthesis C-methylase UbiE